MLLRRVAMLSIAMAFMAIPPAFISQSQVVINEIMQNPEFAGDTDGEWFELFNTGDTPVDINGWTIKDNGTNDHVIDASSPLVISPGDFLVLGRNSDQKINGGVIIHYSYGSDITFGNASDQVILVDPDGVEQDRVEYDDGATFPDPTGASMELLHPSINNNQGSNWREAATSWGGNDRGTPGFMNSVFDSISPTVLSVHAPSSTLVEIAFSEAVDEVTGGNIVNYMITPKIGVPLEAQRDSVDPSLIRLTVDSLTQGQIYSLFIHGVTDLVGNAMEPGNFPFSVATPLAENDIIVTEIMKDPSAAGDTDGEWFEVYNTTQQPIDMGGWNISDGGSNSFVVQGVFVVAPRSFALFCINTDSSGNGGFHASPMYDWGSSGTFTLGNTDDKIILSTDGVTIDSVSYDGGTVWPDLTGASMALSDFSLDNNDGTHWTASLLRQPTYHGSEGDLGSPGTLGENQSAGSAPVVTIQPDTVRFVLGRTESGTTRLTIGNTGGESLFWTIVDSDSLNGCSFLVADPVSGEVLPGATEVAKVRLSSENLPPGLYPCSLILESNDPISPQRVIPVFLEVVDTTIIGSISIPDDFLPVPPEGDTLSVEISMENQTARKRSVDVWITLQRPGESQARMLIDVKKAEFSPFETITRTRSLAIDPHYPAGTYALTLLLGEYPDSVLFSSTFLFDKSGSARLTSPYPGSIGIPETSFLDHSYPSPFNAATTILYGVAEDTWVTLTVFDMLGREVVTLVNEFQFAGYKSVSWNGRNHLGMVAASGPYVYRIEAGAFSQSKTLVFLK